MTNTNMKNTARYGNTFFSLTKVKVKVDIKFKINLKFNIYLKSKISK